ncbi:hypothetical protein COU39_01120 [Candidatus Micrarchaeota archaeon CG10_big_fil_rev_8_21_14_0_10_60_32]|nr:MAG: hypothetical protein AUJ16_02445 [Candidatus Micrarchaeota archaeon CG1_02_60_51]PIN96467.1 MAG: hypothetical protein COU39_01120 [Candidatus Micrarchaeota archaeon CG10_big_fil_rev_8_21_14_0_10_60_32]PIO02454.1 MAG: hypothetical protein COT58_00130 [Candidatus Micrarchaeota archaeon CG09_land_8_20_14_0_10_60_16]
MLDEENLGIKLDVSRGFYALADVSEEERRILGREGYVYHKSLGLQANGSCRFLVKTRSNETAEHALLCWMIAEIIRRKRRKPVLNPTCGVDVFAKIKGKRVGFEVETGNMLLHAGPKGPEKLKEKFLGRLTDCDRLIVVVTNRLLVRKYEKLLGFKVFTRTEIEKVVRDLFA